MYPSYMLSLSREKIYKVLRLGPVTYTYALNKGRRPRLYALKRLIFLHLHLVVMKLQVCTFQCLSLIIFSLLIWVTVCWSHTNTTTFLQYLIQLLFRSHWCYLSIKCLKNFDMVNNLTIGKYIKILRWLPLAINIYFEYFLGHVLYLQ